MSARFHIIFLTLYITIIFKSSSYNVLKISTKKSRFHNKALDYTFEGELNRASGECAFMFLLNNTSAKNHTIQEIKKRANDGKMKRFYEEKEREKKRGKSYYQNVEKESRRRVFEEPDFTWVPDFVPRRSKTRSRPSYHFVKNLQKRSAKSRGHRRQSSNPLFGVTFTDHNNCTSRCILARMEMVNSYGFPEKFLIEKLIEDLISNRKLRLKKLKKVSSCFKKLENVTFDDSCIFSAKLFECLELADPYTWSNDYYRDN